MRLIRPGILAGCLYPDALFRVKTTEKILYLTFDDGPDPHSTPYLLDILEKNSIHAFFFCTGSAASDYPDLTGLIRSKGHSIGNHGYNHLNGWRTGTTEYVADVEKASAITSGNIFRPPYGKISLSQKKLLKKYKLVFWDLMAYDFDKTFGPEKTLNTLKRKIRPGSIIVLHDTYDSCANTIIQEFLDYASEEGYRFGQIENEINFTTKGH
jgi:peptidoglycan-N-acetylglucosamine deacetylase